MSSFVGMKLNRSCRPPPSTDVTIRSSATLKAEWHWSTQFYSWQSSCVFITVAIQGHTETRIILLWSCIQNWGIFIFHFQPCTVHNSTVIYCPTPKIQLPPEFTARIATLDMSHTTPVRVYCLTTQTCIQYSCYFYNIPIVFRFVQNSRGYAKLVSTSIFQRNSL